MKDCDPVAGDDFGLGDFPLALKQYFEALKINEEQNDLVGVFSTSQNIAIVYGDMRDLEKSLEYYSKALKIAEALNDKSKIGLTLGNLAGVYENTNRLNESLEYYERAL